MKWLMVMASMGLWSLTLDVPVARSQQIEPAGDRAVSQPNPKRSAWLHEIYLKDASDYTFSLDDPKRDELTLRREPAMRWTSGGDYQGEVYVWTHQGSAAVVGCIFSGPRGAGARQIMHEFHSLTSVPLVAGKRAGSRWQPTEPGITLVPLPDAPEPARSEVLRLAQMRDMARRFSSQVDREGGMSEMRLLTQPIYRSEIKDAGALTIDGAVFAFVWTAGTDPEALLVFEARRTQNGVRWHYALARFTNREVHVKYQGREIWSVEAASTGIFDGVTSKRYGAYFIKSIPEPSDFQAEPKP